MIFYGSPGRSTSYNQVNAMLLLAWKEIAWILQKQVEKFESEWWWYGRDGLEDNWKVTKPCLRELHNCGLNGNKLAAGCFVFSAFVTFTDNLFEIDLGREVW